MQVLYCLRLCPPTAPVLPIIQNEKCGTFSLYEQLLDKQNGSPVKRTYTV
jgi:hypothetical protein